MRLRTQVGPSGLPRQSLTVGHSKTAAGTGRIIPLNPRAVTVLTHWQAFSQPHSLTTMCSRTKSTASPGTTANRAPGRLFPVSRCTAGKWRWENARKIAGVKCRFHDLRHTFISRLAESQASDSTVMALAGHVSRAMMERYSHIRMEAKRHAVDTLSGTDFEPGVAQNWAQSVGVNPSVETIWNWHTCRSMIFPSQTSSSPSGWRSAGEAEASSAGEQLAEE